MTEHSEKNYALGHTFLFYLCSAGIGTFGMMGLMSFFTQLCISAFHEYSIYPIAYAEFIRAFFNEIKRIQGHSTFYQFSQLIIRVSYHMIRLLALILGRQ